MEIAKDIYFDNDLKAGNEAQLTYSGYLFKNGANTINLVYGFGESWSDTNSIPMEKTDNGFVANITMKDFDTFNFCFSDENNNWDNNYNKNFSSPILSKPEENNSNSTDNNTDAEINFGTDYSASIDEIIEDILENTTKQDIISDKDNTSIDKILETITEETMPEIEALFNDLFFESVKEDEKGNDSIQEISMEPELAQELEEVAKVIESNSLSVPETPVQKISEFDNSELIKQFNELFEESSNPVEFEIIDETQDSIAEFENIQEISPIDQTTTASETVEQKIDVASFNLDNLVSNILEPVISESNPTEKVEETSLFEDLKAHEEDRENSLAIINSGKFTVGSRKLSYFYKLRKRIRLAVMKLSKLKKDFLEQLGL